MNEINPEKLMNLWNSLPVDKRIQLKTLYMPECKCLVNVKIENLMNSGIYHIIKK